MRVSARAINDITEICDVLNRCNTLRIGMSDGDMPYVVPVSFGWERDPDKSAPTIYFHCAKEGLKVDCLAKNPSVCVEGDIFYRTEPLGHGITARYESIIGFGQAIATDGEEKIRGLNLICRRYGYADFSVENCKSLEKTAVYKINLTSITGKRNLPKA